MDHLLDNEWTNVAATKASKTLVAATVAKSEADAASVATTVAKSEADAAVASLSSKIYNMWILHKRGKDGSLDGLIPNRFPRPSPTTVPPPKFGGEQYILNLKDETEKAEYYFGKSVLSLSNYINRALRIHPLSSEVKVNEAMSKFVGPHERLVDIIMKNLLRLEDPTYKPHSDHFLKSPESRFEQSKTKNMCCEFKGIIELLSKIMRAALSRKRVKNPRDPEGYQIKRLLRRDSGNGELSVHTDVSGKTTFVSKSMKLGKHSLVEMLNQLTKPSHKYIGDICYASINRGYVCLDSWFHQHTLGDIFNGKVKISNPLLQLCLVPGTMRQLFELLMYLHQPVKGNVDRQAHGDIKPANILWNAKKLCIEVIDWATAELEDAANPAHECRGETPGYTRKPWIRSYQSMVEADEYAAACTIAKAFANGEQPFERKLIDILKSENCPPQVDVLEALREMERLGRKLYRRDMSEVEVSEARNYISKAAVEKLEKCGAKP